MPVVPRLQNPVQDAALPNVQVGVEAPLAAFGGGDAAAGATKATNDFLQTSIDFASEYKDQADKARFEEAVTNLTAIKNELFWNKNTGAFLRKENAALGIQEEYGSSYDRYVTDIEKGLSNDRQKNQFRNYASKAKVDFNNDLMKHSFQESEKYKEKIYTNSIQTQQNNAVLNWSNPSEVNKSISEINRLIIEKAGYRFEVDEKGHVVGDSNLDENVKATRAKMTGDTYSKIINRMIDHGDDQAAARTYADLKEGIKNKFAYLDDNSVNSIESLLADASYRNGSKRISDELISRHGSAEGAIKEANQMFKKNGDAKLFDLTKERIKSHYSDLEQALKLDGERTARNIVTTLKSNGGDLDKVLPSELAKLKKYDPKYEEEIFGIANNIKNKRSPVGDVYYYQEQERLASSPETRDAWVKKVRSPEFVVESNYKLTDAETKHFYALADGIEKKDVKALETLDGIQGKVAVMEQVFADAGIKKSNEEKYKKASLAANKAYEKYQIDNKGQLPSMSKLQEMIEAEVMQVTKSYIKIPFTDVNLFWGKKNLFEVEPGEAVEPYKLIEPGDSTRKSFIRQYKEANGVEPTEKQLLMLYNQHLINKKSRKK